MKTSLWAPLLMLAVWIGAGYYVKHIYCPCDAPAIIETPAAGQTTSLTITDGAAFSATAKDRNFVFDKSGFEARAPLADEVKNAAVQTADYLKSYPNRTLQITGLYSPDETNTGALSNLGLARANNVKNVFTAAGVPASQISTNSLNSPSLTFPGDSLIGGIAFSFSETTKADDQPTADKLTAVEKKLRDHPFVLYFAPNQHAIDFTSEQRENMSDLIYYLDHKPGSGVEAVGHTDNVGRRSENITLSRERAEFVRDYLSKNGISAAQVSVDGKGQNHPIATNASAEGKAKNRRVVITVR